MSSLTWIDNSEKERQKALDFVDTFRERETRDELGIGVIRDAFSERLFPGTTTVQTRARYFLLIPWVYQRTADYAVRGRTYGQVKEHAQYLEQQSLMHALKAGGDEFGLFGRVGGKDIARLASDVYWNGLGRWGIRRYGASRTQLIREMATRSVAPKRREMADEDKSFAPVSDGHWHAGLPDPQPDLFESTAFELTDEEAKYLRDMLLEHAGKSLLAHLVSTQAEPVSCPTPWDHPEASAFPECNKRELDHAKKFSLLMNGAALLYNLMLAQRRLDLEWPDERGLASRYREDVDAWARSMNYSADELSSWDVVDFWSAVESMGAKVNRRTHDFVSTWLRHALSNPAEAVEDERIRRLLRQREIDLKGGLARLESSHALGSWNGASGVEPLNYRWGTVQVIVNDIVTGMARD